MSITSQVCQYSINLILQNSLGVEQPDELFALTHLISEPQELYFSSFFKVRDASSSYYTLDSTRLPPDVPLSDDRTGVEGEGRELENGKLIGSFRSSVCISEI